LHLIVATEVVFIRHIMPNLEVSGASIYYEEFGAGPLLLCISGGDGTTEIWEDFAAALKDRFKVVSWNRTPCTSHDPINDPEADGQSQVEASAAAISQVRRTTLSALRPTPTTPPA